MNKIQQQQRTYSSLMKRNLRALMRKFSLLVHGNLLDSEEGNFAFSIKILVLLSELYRRNKLFRQNSKLKKYSSSRQFFISFFIAQRSHSFKRFPQVKGTRSDSKEEKRFHNF